jgi:hypothetical protein
LQLRTIRNKAWEWTAAWIALVLTRNYPQLKTGRIIHWWQRAGKSAEMTRETAGMFALEAPTR